MFKLKGYGAQMGPRYIDKTKLYLLDSDDIDYSHDRELNQSENFTLVKDRVVSIKAIHMVVSMIYLKANRTDAFGM